MSAEKTTLTGRGKRTAGRWKKANESVLSLNDLQIPVEPLLDREEEHQAGLRIRASLRRLAELLPRHPEGYLRYLARMNQVVAGGGLMFTWLSLRESMADDARKALRARRRAEDLAATEPEKALRAYERGVAVLRTYPLDPETLYQWSLEVARGREHAGDLVELERLQKVSRLLRNVLETLGRYRNRLIMPNFRLVLKEVFRYHPTGMRHSDLFQEGVLGLQKAVFRFDPHRATRFSTYATYWIRQAIRKALIDKARMIRVPQAVQEDLRKSETHLPAEEVERVRRIMTETVLFSAGESDDPGDRNSFAVPDPTGGNGGEGLRTLRIPGAVSAALERLDTRAREVLRRRFGLGGERPQTLEEIGRRMNLSRERIRQLEREALERMKTQPALRDLYEDLDAVSSGVLRN